MLKDAPKIHNTLLIVVSALRQHNRFAADNTITDDGWLFSALAKYVRLVPMQSSLHHQTDFYH